MQIGLYMFGHFAQLVVLAEVSVENEDEINITFKVQTLIFKFSEVPAIWDPQLFNKIIKYLFNLGFITAYHYKITDIT